MGTLDSAPRSALGGPSVDDSAMRRESLRDSGTPSESDPSNQNIAAGPASDRQLLELRALSDDEIAKFGLLKDPYRVLVDTRNFEIGLFWQRSNYFLVLNTALAIGFFNLKEQKYALVLAAMGAAASALWLAVCLGGKYWQVRWEQRLKDFEIANLNGLAFFSASQSRIDSDVARGLEFIPPRGLKRLFYAIIRRGHPSVSFAMMLLATLFVAAWVALGVFRFDL